jgi:hypothetical protein
MLIKRYFLYAIFFSLIIVIFAGCASKEPEKQILPIADLATLPQNVAAYINNLDENSTLYNQRQAKHPKYYFNVWNMSEPREKLSAIKWPFRSYTSKNSFGENLQPLESSFFTSLYENANFEAYGSLNQNAITLGYTNIRLFPSDKPLFKDPLVAGEGFPFDYVQNSSVAANKPLFVSHYSKDRQWVYVFSSFASGWIKTNEFVFLDKTYTDRIQNAQQIFFTKEGVALFDKENTFLLSSRIGVSLPLIEESDTKYKVLVIASSKKMQPLFLQVEIDKNIAEKDFLTFTKANMTQIIQEVFGSKYGWGGMFEERDCSSMIRDIFTPFGIWLPRNSYQQSRVGKIFSLEELSDDAKLAFIKKEGVPFKTLLYKKGHIVLYVGTYNNDVVILHNTWGIKTKDGEKEGRIIIGKTLFSTLKLGKEQPNYNEEAELLRNIKSMNIITE